MEDVSHPSGQRMTMPVDVGELPADDWTPVSILSNQRERRLYYSGLSHVC